jgi:hypothetical protein
MAGRRSISPSGLNRHPVRAGFLRAKARLYRSYTGLLLPCSTLMTSPRPHAARAAETIPSQYRFSLSGRTPHLKARCNWTSEVSLPSA